MCEKRIESKDIAWNVGGAYVHGAQTDIIGGFFVVQRVLQWGDFITPGAADTLTVVSVIGINIPIRVNLRLILDQETTMSALRVTGFYQSSVSWQLGIPAAE